MRLFLALLLLSGCAAHFDPRVTEQSIVQIIGIFGGGTGFLVYGPSGKEYILTNKHVCEGALLAQNKGQTIVVDIIEVSKITDLCLIDSHKLHGSLSIGSVEPKQHDVVHVIGWGNLLGNAYTMGHYVGRLMEVILSVTNPAYATVQILAGNSGSPVMNDAGEVVGVAYASSGAIANRTLMVPLDQIQAFLQGR